MSKSGGCTPRVRWFTQNKGVEVEVIFRQGQGEVEFLEENTFPFPLFSITDVT
jgi:hypothetical protein